MRITPSYLQTAAVITGAVLCLLCSCKDNPGDNGGGGQSNGTTVVFALGDSYVYRWTLAMTDSIKDSVRYDFRTDTAFSSVDAVNQNVDTLTGLIRMKSKMNNQTATAIHWYRQRDSMLTEVAYSSAGAGGTLVLPKSESAVPTMGAGDDGAPWTLLPRSVEIFIRKKRSAADSATKRSDPRIVYKFPLQTGKEWLSFSDPFPQYRFAVGKETVYAGGRAYTCVKIKTTLPTMDPLGDIEWYDYVCATGLILRTISLRGVVRTESSPDSAGTFISTERLELLSTTKK